MRPSILLLTVVLAASSLSEALSGPPNIVFILADDLGWRDLGCYGSTYYETPHLDRLAEQGMRFTDAYASCCVCSPTRASILTGKYPARLHLTDYIPGHKIGKLLPPLSLQQLPLEEVTFAEVLKGAGYATAFIGKWHLGNQPFYPDQQGFDLNLGGCEKGHPDSYFSPYKIPTLSDGPAGEYLTDRLTDEALRFIKNSREKPFLLYLSHYAVHNPQQAKPAWIAKFKTKAQALPVRTGAEFLPEGKSQTRQIQDRPVYAAMLASLDESVGRIMAQLADLGLEKNTVIVFTSDNGGLSTSEGSPTSNVPLRAGKGWNYEGGIREPLLVKWPGVTHAGAICQTPMISTDFYPTFLEVAGVRPVAGQQGDGVSLVPLLKGGAIPERSLYWHYPHYGNQGGSPSGAIRLSGFKLVEWFEGMRVELFNLQEDIAEQHDLSTALPEKAAALRQELHAWRNRTKASMPEPNPDARQIRGKPLAPARSFARQEHAESLD